MGGSTISSITKAKTKIGHYDRDKYKSQIETRYDYDKYKSQIKKPSSPKKVD